MEHMQQQQPQQQQQQQQQQLQDGTGGRTSSMSSVQEAAINSQEEAMIRFSPSSPFVTMRHYISEFDPNESVTNMTMNALKLAESWKAYIDTFVDLCDVDKVPIENRRKLLLLLAGSKLRRLLCQLETASETQTATLEETVRLLTQHFENRRSTQMARFNFFYGPHNRRRLGESLNDWTSRLITLTEKCQFSKDIADGMTVNDALTVVMYKQSHEEMSVKQKDGKKNGATPIKKGETGSDGEEDEEQPMPVELQWGDGDDAGQQQQQQQQHPVMKVESGEVNVQQHHQQQQQQQGGGGVVQLNSFIYASRPPPAAMQQLPRLPTEPSFPPGINNQNAGNLSHSDMDLLRRARGGPCICPNCTLFPKRRAGKHNCHIPGCGREYSKTSHLRAHLVSHCNVLPFACSWVGCNKRFYRTDQLTRHARIHTGEKKFTCGVCDHAFSRSDHLAKHVRRHTNVNAAGANVAGTNGGPPPNANNNGANNNSNNNSRNTVLGNNAVQSGPANNSSVGPAQTANNLLAGNTSNNLAAAVAAAANHQQHMLGMPPLPYMQMPHKNPPHFLYH